MENVSRGRNLAHQLPLYHQSRKYNSEDIRDQIFTNFKILGFRINSKLKERISDSRDE